MEIKAVVFDFDGVIVSHSEFFKEDAWKKVFANYKGRYEYLLIEATSKYGFGKHGDRFDILKYVYSGLGIPESALGGLVSQGAALFDTYVQNKIIDFGTAPEVHETLGILKKTYPIYLNSGTSQNALEQSVASLKIGLYFKGVLGGPLSKAENMIKISNTERISTTEILLVGDSHGDVDAAAETRCQFIGVANKWNKWKKADKSFPAISNVREILDIL